jgi:hypothetical protein
MAGMVFSSGAPYGVGLIESNRVIGAFWTPVVSAAIGELRSAARDGRARVVETTRFRGSFGRALVKTAQHACMSVRRSAKIRNLSVLHGPMAQRVRRKRAAYNNTRGRA